MMTMYHKQQTILTAGGERIISLAIGVSEIFQVMQHVPETEKTPR